jgi:L-asparaginase
MSIKIFVTGGTFDKEYDEIRGQLYFNETHLPEILRLGRCTLDVQLETLMMIDSLHMTADDRNRIVDNCRNCINPRIIITHGTDTMVETARCIAEAGIAKTIILTGAMIPYKFGSSDGLFNMGCALSFAQTLPNGVYITMNGRYFVWNNVRKNKEEGFFEELTQG